ncbi:hypothetical protein B0I35DRAFT_223039 [Stachybotrys elegans]|uniref:DUF4185 domain-containing protein n=1 Tax=Stachybotrys elegans TaxID=80388 RepID=A0A8K0SNH3_9HYPO|nr:hypothetical protein B0I35DRAFT_223039 [Stachybotrys elegans]
MMRPSYKAVIGALVFLVAQSAAQLTNWNLTAGQNSTWICTWRQPRAALVRDTIYFDGGQLYWQAGFEDGSNTMPAQTESRIGYILSYNLSRAFSLDTNVSEIFVENMIEKGGRAGGGFSRLDGAMLANDDQLLLLGGAQSPIVRDDISDEDEAVGYLLYPQRDDVTAFERVFTLSRLPDGITDWIAYGGSTSAPSENKAWYFSGYTTLDDQPVLIFPNGSTATNVVNRLVTVDFDEIEGEPWSTQNLTSSIEGRANPEVVWVPVGEQGILVVLGGVTYPQWVNPDSASEDPEASIEESPAFMQRIDIYDVASRRWYRQRSQNYPVGSFTQGCAVVATAADRSSFNIYYYGGFDGLDPRADFYDDVWVLSLPSFEWIPLNRGSSGHARAGHRCFMPYPDQMMVFGGYTPVPGASMNCLEDGPVLNFNLSSGQWMNSYDPRNHPDYGVPRAVYDIIGGDSTGGSNITGPSGGWQSRELEEIFENRTYNISRIWEHTPYNVDSEPGPPNSPGNGPEEGGGGNNGLPSWVAPVLGVVLGLMLLAAILVIFFLWRKRKIFKNRSSDSGTNNRILPWLWAQPSPEKGMTSTASEITAARTLSPEMSELRSVSGPTAGTVTATASPDPEQYRYEVPDTQIYAELGGKHFAACRTCCFCSKSSTFLHRIQRRRQGKRCHPFHRCRCRCR